MLRLGFLASHGGSAMRAIVEAISTGRLNATAQVVLSNNSRSPALAFAREASIPAFHLSELSEGSAERLDEAICATLANHDVTHVVLSGYMKKLGPRTLTRFADRILNVHPALLPRYGGQGMYGNHVHEAVLAARETDTGVTIHLVDPEYDHGRILGQCKVAIVSGDTPGTLAERVKAAEQRFFVEVLQKVATGEIKV